MSFPGLVTELATTLVPVGLLAVASVRGSRSWPMPLPAVGVFDRGDVVLIAGSVTLFPLVARAAPAWLMSGLLGVLIIVSLCDLGWRFLSHWSVRTFGAAGLVVAVVTMTARGWSVAWAINDLLLGLTVVAIVSVWVQTGMQPRHLAALAGFLTIYDFVATHMVGITGDVMKGSLDGPVTFVFVVELAGNRSLLGFGDVLMICALAAAAFGSYPRRRASAFCAAVFVAFALADAYAYTHRGSFVAVMTFVGPVAVAATWAAERSVSAASPYGSQALAGDPAAV